MTSGRESLRALQNRVRAAQERTLAVEQKVTKRRAARKEQAAAAPKPEVPSFDLALTNGGQEKQRPVTSNQVREWFRAGLTALYGDKLTLPRDSEWWTVKEKSLAKRLLTQYGPELVQKAVAHFCSTWNQRVEAAEGRLGGIPTLGLLWKIRERVFAEAQGVVPQPTKPTRRRRNKRDVGEYKEGKPIGFGWGK